MGSFHADVCLFWIPEKQNLNNTNWKNSKFNHKEPAPASCTSCECIGLTGRCQCSGNTGFRLQLARMLKKKKKRSKVMFQKTPINGFSLSRMWLGNTVRVVPWVQTLLALARRKTCPRTLSHNNKSFMLREFTCGGADLGQVRGPEQAD